jgi:Co/Zn/Cd efflux system component
MSAHCCHQDTHGPEQGGAPSSADPRWRRALWIALIVNAAMFVVELAAGWTSGSVSLLADAVDFAGDAANYGLSLAVLGMAAAWQSRAALVKGLSMAVYGAFVLGKAAWLLQSGAIPEPLTMGLVGSLALVANASVAALLYAWRGGNANMRSVWLCTRNDALGNLAVIAAAFGVFGTGTVWPDLLVAAVMASLAIAGGWSVVRQARGELWEIRHA